MPTQNVQYIERRNETPTIKTGEGQGYGQAIIHPIKNHKISHNLGHLNSCNESALWSQLMTKKITEKSKKPKVVSYHELWGLPRSLGHPVALSDLQAMKGAGYRAM